MMLIHDLREAAPPSSLLISSNSALVVLGAGGEEKKHIALGDVRVSQPLLKIKSHNKTTARARAVLLFACIFQVCVGGLLLRLMHVNCL